MVLMRNKIFTYIELKYFAGCLGVSFYEALMTYCTIITKNIKQFWSEEIDIVKQFSDMLLSRTVINYPFDIDFLSDHAFHTRTAQVEPNL